MKNIISTDKAPAAIGPYSQAVEVNGLVFTSGVVPIDPATGELVTGPAEVQAERAFKSLKALLEAAGSSTANVIKTTVFISDMNDFGKINDAVLCDFSGSATNYHYYGIKFTASYSHRIDGINWTNMYVQFYK